MTQGQTDISTVVRPGDVLAGKYRVERVLGIGGMGAVVSAVHLQLEERVAIKFLLPELASNPDVVTRFLREGRAAIKIRSEHVVRVFDVGTFDSGAPYMVMEYLEGCDLGQLVEQRGRLAIPDAVDSILQACEALAEAHAMGIVHRDLKPANLFLSRRADGSAQVKVLDFGISKVKSPTDTSMTRTQAVMGSPRYMSPEQMRSTRNVDARSDIWALGAVLQELLAGIPPFDAETMTELCARILQDSPAPLRQLRPDAPPGLELAVATCLQKEPAHRFPHVGAFAMAIAEFGTPQARTSADRIVRVLQAAGMIAPSASAPPGYGSAVNTGQFQAMGSQPPRGSATGGAWGEMTGAHKKSSNVGLIAAIGGGLAFLLIAVVAIAIVVSVKRTPKQAASTPPAIATEIAPPPATTTAAAIATATATVPEVEPAHTAIADAGTPPAATTATTVQKPIVAQLPNTGKTAAPPATVKPPPPPTANPFEGRR